jgi:hypothetical protein
VFFLPAENLQFSDIITRNADEEYLKQFKAYYHQHDPFRVTRGGVGTKCVVRIEDVVSYPSFTATEYYNEFYRPQQIHYKTVVYLWSNGRLLGIIALLRPRKAQNFSKEDITLLRTAIPYLSHVLEYCELKKMATLKEHLLKAFELHRPSPLFVFDHSMDLLYANQKAKELSRRFVGSQGNREGLTSMPPRPDR